MTAAGVAALAWLSAPGPAAATDMAPTCRPASTALARLPDLPEASGVAASRRVEGRLWAINDSGDPVVVALDASGAVTGRVTIRGATNQDWEALSAGPCPAGWCLYVADIGDNNARRRSVTIYRVAEPERAAGTVDLLDRVHVTYPDGAHDAETLLVTPDGDVYIVTKGDTGHVALYRLPRGWRNGATVGLERVGRPRAPAKPGRDDRITDGAVSPDGRWVVLRTVRGLAFHRAAQLLAGNWEVAGRMSLEPLDEPQGEGIAFASPDEIVVVGEGGGKSRPGTLARLTCARG